MRWGTTAPSLVDRGERWWRTRPEVPAPTGVVNGVLGCESVTIPPDGVVARDWGIEFGSIAVTHHGPSNDPVLVFAGGPVAADRPGGGPTTARLDARSGGSFALTGRLLNNEPLTIDLSSTTAFTVTPQIDVTLTAL